MTGEDSSLKGYYAARAGEYDRIYEKPERQADLCTLRSWLPSRFSGRRVLEVACGTGYWTRLIMTEAAAIVAVDAALETLEIARARVPDAKVTFLVADAYGLARDLGSHPCSRVRGPFDAALVAFWFSHVPIERRRKFLVGLGGMLLPGAVVVLLDNRFVQGSSTPIAGADPQGNTYQMRRLADGSVHRVLKNFPTEAELNESATGVGIKARYTGYDYFWVFEYEVTA